MGSFPDFAEDELERDAEATAYVQHLRQALSSHAGGQGRRGTSRIAYVTWVRRGVRAVVKEVHLPAEDTFTDVAAAAQRMWALERARAAAVHAEWPLVRCLALHIDDSHHYQWLLERAGLVTLRDAMVAGVALAPPAAAPLPYITENMACVVVRQVLVALRVLHEELNLLHGDVSPSNIFLDFGEPGTAGQERLAASGVRLGDLDGLVPRTGTVAQHAVPPFRGSPLYTPLEWLLSPDSDEVRGAAMNADIWAVGIVLYQLLSRKGPSAHPFIGDSGNERHTMLSLIEALEDARRAVQEEPAALAQLLRDGAPCANEEALFVVARCLDWRGQWSASQLLQLAWLQPR